MLFMVQVYCNRLITEPPSELKNSNDLGFEWTCFNRDSVQLAFDEIHCDGVPLLIKKEKEISGQFS